MKRCKAKSCRQKFEPWNSLAKACSPECALEVAQQERQAKERRQIEAARKADRQRLEELKPRAKHLKEAQATFNAYIRARDEGLPCISCGRNDNDLRKQTVGGTWDCGHYRSTGACPELRFEPLNAARQCKRCNRDDSGNVVEYRINLIQRIGQANVEWLEQAHEPKHYTIEDLKEIKAHYRRLTRELQKQREAA